MKKRKVISQTMLYQSAGFTILTALIWLSELVDLPHLLFNMEKTPFNLTECLYESMIIAAFGLSVLLKTRHTIKHIRYLEGFLPVCSFCKKIRINDTWIPIEEFLKKHGEVEFSHGLCPACAEEHYGHILNKPEKKT